MNKLVLLGAVLLAVFSGRAPAALADASDLQALREQVRALEQQLKALARQIELREEAAAAAAAAAARVSISDRGFSLASVDSANSIRLRGLVHFDARTFFRDGGVVNNAFVLRRARVSSEGQFAKNYGFQFVAEFGGSNVSIVDANFTVAMDRALQFKFGKFKTPVGLESLVSDSFTFFNERSLATNLVPNRDLGVQASGDLLGGTLSYQLGAFGGVADGGSSNNTDFDNGKDLVARVMAAPFRHAAGSPLHGLSLGVSASSGRQRTAAGRTAGYRTDGQQTFFSYNPAVVADGGSWRVSPQFEYRNGPFGAMGEYVASTVNVRPNASGAKAELQNRAWQLAVGYVVTGEDSSATGVLPRTNFDYSGGTWGGLEVVARVADLRVDDAAFPVFASPAGNADEAKSLAFGFNWYLSKAVVFKVDYYQTRFGLSALAPAISTAPLLRQDENAFITRFQVSF